MTDKELRRLSRSELLEMLLAQIKENEQLQSRLDETEAQLHDRKIAIANAGSIAEAALALNNVFQAAENAVNQYVENIRMEAEKQAADILREAEAYSQKTHAQADDYRKQVVASDEKHQDEQDTLPERFQSVGEVETK